MDSFCYSLLSSLCSCTKRCGGRMPKRNLRHHHVLLIYPAEAATAPPERSKMNFYDVGAENAQARNNDDGKKTANVLLIIIQWISRVYCQCYVYSHSFSHNIFCVASVPSTLLFCVPCVHPYILFLCLLYICFASSFFLSSPSC